MDARPRFRTKGPKHAARLFLHCSNCDSEIREIKNHELIDLTHGYYCKDCDDGAIHLNVKNQLIGEKEDDGRD